MTQLAHQLVSYQDISFHLVKTVLQHHWSSRIDKQQEKTHVLASQVTEEVSAIWARARVPTSAPKNVTQRVVEAVEWWRSKHNLEARRKEHFQELFDIASKLRGKVSEEAQLDHLKKLMRQESAMKGRKTECDEYDWEVDFQFYVDQAKGDRVKTLGVVDGKLHEAVKATEEREVKRARYYECKLCLHSLMKFTIQNRLF